MALKILEEKYPNGNTPSLQWTIMQKLYNRKLLLESRTYAIL